MYFWRTDQLIDDLKQNRVTQGDFKKLLYGQRYFDFVGLFCFKSDWG